MPLDRPAVRTMVDATRDNMLVLGARIRRARERAGQDEGAKRPMSYRRAAEETSLLDHVTFQRVEKGLWVPTREQLEQLLEFIESHTG